MNSYYRKFSADDLRRDKSEITFRIWDIFKRSCDNANLDLSIEETIDQVTRYNNALEKFDAVLCQVKRMLHDGSEYHIVFKTEAGLTLFLLTFG